MKYLLFDYNAIAIYVSRNSMQSVEYASGQKFLGHLLGKEESGVLEDVSIEHMRDGILFVGKKAEANKDNENKVLCVDLTVCDILSEQNNSAVMLNMFQKMFRTALKIWNRRPFSSSERINGSKTILFPFIYPDRRRIVIERSVQVEQLEKRNIDYPLLVYKYCNEDSHAEDIVDTAIIKKAGKEYAQQKIILRKKLEWENVIQITKADNAMGYYSTGKEFSSREHFIFMDYEHQKKYLTETQESVIDFADDTVPLRVEGAAGTGKTLSLILRAYNLLMKKREAGESFRIVFFSHNRSTCEQGKTVFEHYPRAEEFMEEGALQKIEFMTLLDYCKDFAQIEDGLMLETEAGDAKTYQLMLIREAIEKALSSNEIDTFMPLLSEGMRELFSDMSDGNKEGICYLLQHEFSIQIKGRTDCTLEQYKEIPPIANGLACKNEKDREMVFRLFSEYQNSLQDMNNFDVDDVTIEALSRLNAPLWRRKREQEGFHYIIVDEMHLFNINEQSVFHFLTTDRQSKNIPICFALDYCQAIGDRGDTSHDYVENAFGKIEKRKYKTVFRNSPHIINLCASIAASGTLMFQSSFNNPYESLQHNFTEQEEKKSDILPKYLLLRDDKEMLYEVGEQLGELVKILQCKKNDIAIVSFDTRILSEEGAKNLSDMTNKDITYAVSEKKENAFQLMSAYDVNGLEFDAVVMVGVDEGRIPQAMGTSDISEHFLRYSAYNMLYLVASRAKYRVVILGNKLHGRSSCLTHSIEAGYLEIDEK